MTDHTEYIRDFLARMTADREWVTAKWSPPRKSLLEEGDVVKAIAEHETGPDTLGTSDGVPLLVVVSTRGWSAVVKAALQAGANPDLLQVRGVGDDGSLDGERTALSMAAASGSLEVVDLLLEAGADVRSRDDRQMGPIHFARSPEVAVRLIEAGADPFSKTGAGQTPLDIVRNKRGGPTLHGTMLALKKAGAARLEGRRGNSVKTRKTKRDNAPDDSCAARFLLSRTEREALSQIVGAQISVEEMANLLLASREGIRVELGMKKRLVPSVQAGAVIFRTKGSPWTLGEFAYSSFDHASLAYFASKLSETHGSVFTFEGTDVRWYTDGEETEHVALDADVPEDADNIRDLEFAADDVEEYFREQDIRIPAFELEGDGYVAEVVFENTKKSDIEDVALVVIRDWD